MQQDRILITGCIMGLVIKIRNFERVSSLILNELQPCGALLFSLCRTNAPFADSRTRF